MHLPWCPQDMGLWLWNNCSQREASNGLIQYHVPKIFKPEWLKRFEDSMSARNNAISLHYHYIAQLHIFWMYVHINGTNKGQRNTHIETFQWKKCAERDTFLKHMCRLARYCTSSSCSTESRNTFLWNMRFEICVAISMLSSCSTELLPWSLCSNVDRSQLCCGCSCYRLTTKSWTIKKTDQRRKSSKVHHINALVVLSGFGVRVPIKADNREPR